MFFFTSSIFCKLSHLPSALEDVSNGLIGRPADLKLLKVPSVRAEDEHLADAHHVGGEGAGLVRADNGGAAQGLHGGKGPANKDLLFAIAINIT